jgi:hypothetical protein
MKNKKITIGRYEYIWLVATDQKRIPARIDTGARTSSVWASNIVESGGVLSWTFIAPESEFWTGQKITSRGFEERIVSSSTGHKQVRYRVPVKLQIKGRRIKTFATLADRSHAAFPVLIGRNTLSGKFVVDVQHGSRHLDQIEDDFSNKLQSLKENKI